MHRGLVCLWDFGPIDVEKSERVSGSPCEIFDMVSKQLLESLRRYFTVLLFDLDSGESLAHASRCHACRARPHEWIDYHIPAHSQQFLD